MDEFAGSFMQADRLFVMDIYAASEKPIEGVTAEALSERIGQFGHRSVTHIGTIERGVEAILAAVEPGDVVLTLGAGSVWQAGEQILARLKTERTEKGTSTAGDVETGADAGARRTGNAGKAR